MTSDRVYEATCGAMAELVAHGVRDAVISPGSRSAPLAVAAEWTVGLTTTMHLDERSAGFFALGLAKASGAPVVLICTSGTAAANYLPAIAEAHYSGVPLIIFTADRPPELRDWGAGQTIDQVDLYGSHTRWAVDLAVAGEVDPSWFRRMAARAVAEATAPGPGPVHLNWPLREPLEPTVAMPSIQRQAVVRLPSSPLVVAPAEIAVLSELSQHERGLIVCGPSTLDRATISAIASFSERTGWPVVAEPSSGLRFGSHIDKTSIIATADHLLKIPEWADAHRADVVIRIGDSPTCKPLRLWLEGNPPTHHVLLDSNHRWNEASFTATQVLWSDIALLMAEADIVDRGASSWTDSWSRAEHLATEAIERVLRDGPLLEPLIARAVAATLPGGSALYVSNSMPVRDIDGFAASSASGPKVYSNRGASGIDGLVSSATGVAAAGARTTLLVGDIALLHDISGLLFAARMHAQLTLVVPNNDGGGIFSFLPIAGVPDADADAHFNKLFHTPHGTDLSEFGSLTGITHHLVADRAALESKLRATMTRRGVDIIEVHVDVDANISQHREVTAAVGDALES